MDTKFNDDVIDLFLRCIHLQVDCLEWLETGREEAPQINQLGDHAGRAFTKHWEPEIYTELEVGPRCPELRRLESAVIKKNL